MTWHRGGLVWGIFFLAAGIVFLLDRLDVWDVGGAVVWPLLLIVVGVAIIAGGRNRKEPTEPPPSSDVRTTD